MKEMMSKEKMDAIAQRLSQAEATRQVIEPVREEIAVDDMASAYAIQQINVDRRIAAGERVVGRKIGLTSLAVQKQLGVDQPDFGALFASMSYGDAQPIPLSKFIQPKVEAEIALVLKSDLTQTRHTYADIIRATGYALAAIEIVDSRIRNWDIRFVDTVADNASSAAFVLGSRPVSLANVDLCAATMTMARGDGVSVSQGSGSACLGNPLNAAVWLADRMVQLGTPLKAGDIVLTGALGPMAAVTEPDTYTVSISGLGNVRARFE
ncbi:2-oxopent-4-enoate hydratase [Paraburkholderia atlantica]|uniref:2-oxopent-4-enoate hydratase n=2 Tax=Paraburkholderia atlantica TaxID=2654982 RepID=D5WI20_PARAM|nr:2-oxopent-4-enoate hydratase [Paraburkholderia atlantica]